MKKLIIILFAIPVVAIAINTANKQIKASKEIEIRPANRVDIYADALVKNENELRMEDLTGGEYVSLKSPSALAGNVNLTLPPDDGLVDQILRTDGSGVLTWVDGFSFNAVNDNRILRADTVGPDGIQESASATTLDDAGFLAGLTRLQVDNIDLDGTTIKNNITTGLTLLSGSAGDLTLNPNGNDVSVTGGFEVVSTLESSHPCPTMDNTARGLLTAVSGDCIYSSTDSELQQYTGTAWEPIGTGGGAGGDSFILFNGFEKATDITDVTCTTGTCAEESVAPTVEKKSLKVTASSEAINLKQCAPTAKSDEWIGKMIQVSCFIKNDIPDVQLCANSDSATTDDSADEQCLDVPTNDIPRTIRTVMGLNTGEEACWKIRGSSSQSGTLIADTCKIAEFSPSGTTRVLEQVYEISQDTANLTTTTGTIRWGTITSTGESHLTYTDADGRFTATKTQTVNISWGSRADTTSKNYRILKNGTVIAYDDESNASHRANVATTVKLEAGDYLETATSGTVSPAIPSYLSIVATAYEQATVLAQPEGWYIDAGIGGANPGLSTGNVATYDEIANGSLDLVKNAGSADVGITCDGTNEGVLGGLTCPVGNETLGVVFEYSGKVEACATFTHYAQANGAGNLQTVFQLIRTPNDAQTNTQLGNERVGSTPDGDATTAQTVGTPVKVCGFFDASGKTTIRVKYEQLTAATVSTNIIRADRAASIGQRDIHFTVKPIATNIVGTFKPAVSATIVRQSSAQALTPTAADIDYDTIVHDPDGNFSLANDEYTVPETGLYLFLSTTRIAGHASGGYRTTKYELNGSTTDCFAGPSTSNAAANDQFPAPCLKFLVAGDLIRLQAEVQNNSNTIASSTLDYVQFSVVKVDQSGTINDVATNAVTSGGRIKTCSGTVENTGTASIVSDFKNCIASVNRDSVGAVTVTFESGFFSVAPSCTGSNGGLTQINPDNITTSVVVVNTYQFPANVRTATDVIFTFNCTGE